MNEACLYDIMEAPTESLRQVLPKISVRALARLIGAYPRAIGRTLTALMSESMSPATNQFLNEQLLSAQFPSWSQVRAAESEFVKILHELNG